MLPAGVGDVGGPAPACPPLVWPAPGLLVAAAGVVETAVLVGGALDDGGAEVVGGALDVGGAEVVGAAVLLTFVLVAGALLVAAVVAAVDFPVLVWPALEATELRAGTLLRAVVAGPDGTEGVDGPDGPVLCNSRYVTRPTTASATAATSQGSQPNPDRSSRRSAVGR